MLYSCFTIFFITMAQCTVPILYSDNPSAVPVQSFDFVYIPKEVVQNHLPAFEKRKLNIEAHKIAVENKIKPPAFNETAAQVQLVEWFKRRKINEHDPKGERRALLNRTLCKSQAELDLLIPQRKNLITDLQRLHKKIQRDCSQSNTVRLSDFQDSECRAMKEHSAHLSVMLMQMNEQERRLLQLIIDTRKDVALL